VPPPAWPQRELVSFCRIRSILPNHTQQCELRVAATTIARSSRAHHGDYTYLVSAEIGDGTRIVGTLIVGQGQGGASR
jgi:hypothetical protein